MNSIPEENVITLYNNFATRELFIEKLKWLNLKLKEPGNTGIVIFSGHGNQRYDDSRDEPDGFDEYFVLESGIIIDDELTELFKDIHDESLLITFADCCSSGSSLDDLPGNNTFHWISFGSSTDKEDSLQTGDGGTLAVNFTALTKNELNEDLLIIAERLTEMTRCSFIGELQHITVRASHKELWKRKILLDLN